MSSSVVKWARRVQAAYEGTTEFNWGHGAWQSAGGAQGSTGMLGWAQ